MPFQRCSAAIGVTLAALFAVSMWVTPADAQPTNDIGSAVCATITLLEGASTLVQSPQVQRPLGAGETLYAGSTLQTGVSSKVELTLADRSVIRLDEDSSVQLGIDARGSENQAGRFQVKLLKGEIWVTLPGQPEDFKPPQILVADTLLVGDESAFRAVLFKDGAAEIKTYSGYVTASGPFVFAMENSRWLIQSPGADGTNSKEPWRYRIDPYWKIIIRASGDETKPFRFSARADLSDWVRWNQQRDAAVK